MALVPCAQCRQPFYASCHDASCIGAVCPYCVYAETITDEIDGAVSTSSHIYLTGGHPPFDGHGVDTPPHDDIQSARRS